MGDKGDKNAARPPEGSLVETRCLIKSPKSAIVPFAEPCSGPKSRTGTGAPQKAKSRVRSKAGCALDICRCLIDVQNWHRGARQELAVYLSLPPTRHDLTQGQKPEGRLK